LGDVSVCDARRGRPRRDGGCVKGTHGFSCKPIPEESWPRSSWSDSRHGLQDRSLGI
jgi:hypothetical protein